MGLLNGGVLTATGDTLDATLDWWESSERRRAARARLASAAAIDPDQVIMSPDAARRAGLTSTVVFPLGNLAPQGSVIKATAIDAIGDRRRRRLPASRSGARVHRRARRDPGGQGQPSETPVREGDVIVLIGTGPSGTGMQETAQITTALRYLPWGKHVALVTDGRFSGLLDRRLHRPHRPRGAGRRTDRTGAGRRSHRDRDRPEHADRHASTSWARKACRSTPTRATRCSAAGRRIRASRRTRSCPTTAASGRRCSASSGGTWGGCVYDVDRIVAALDRAARDVREELT